MPYRKLKYKVGRVRFKTKRAKKKYLSWNKIIKKAPRGVTQKTKTKLKRFQKYWVGK